jgi:hypothetical protein
MHTILSFDIGIYNLAFANVSISNNDIQQSPDTTQAQLAPIDKSLHTVINDWGILCLKSENDNFI